MCRVKWEKTVVRRGFPVQVEMKFSVLITADETVKKGEREVLFTFKGPLDLPGGVAVIKTFLKRFHVILMNHGE